MSKNNETITEMILTARTPEQAIAIEVINMSLIAFYSKTMTAFCAKHNKNNSDAFTQQDLESWRKLTLDGVDIILQDLAKQLRSNAHYMDKHIVPAIANKIFN